MQFMAIVEMTRFIDILKARIFGIFQKAGIYSMVMMAMTASLVRTEMII